MNQLPTTKQLDILNTAERLFDRQGFHATGVDQIVREANVTPRTLYRHFASKEQLILDVLAHRESRFLHKLETMIKNPNHPPLWEGVSKLNSGHSSLGYKSIKVCSRPGCRGFIAQRTRYGRL